MSCRSEDNTEDMDVDVENNRAGPELDTDDEDALPSWQKLRKPRGLPDYRSRLSPEGYEGVHLSAYCFSIMAGTSCTHCSVQIVPLISIKDICHSIQSPHAQDRA